MNKIFTVFLLLIFGFGIISCADNDSSGATSQLGNVLDQPNSTDDENSMNLPVITDRQVHVFLVVSGVWLIKHIA